MVNALGAAALGLADRRPAPALYRQLPDDVRLRADRRGYRHTHPAAHFSTLQAGARAIGTRTITPRMLPPQVAQFRVDLQFIAPDASLFSSGKVVAPPDSHRPSDCSANGIANWSSSPPSCRWDLALPMAYYFHRATTIGLPSNMVVVPLMQVADARCHRRARFGICLALAGKSSRARHRRSRWTESPARSGLGGLRVADLRVPDAVARMIASLPARLYSPCGGAAAVDCWPARTRRDPRRVAGARIHSPPHRARIPEFWK